MDKISRWLQMPKKILRKYISPWLCTLGWFSGQRQSTAVKNNNSKLLGKGEESDFQSYHIITFKCPVFNKNITRHTKKQESVTHSEEKVYINEIWPWIEFMAEERQDGIGRRRSWDHPFNGNTQITNNWWIIWSWWTYHIEFFTTFISFSTCYLTLQ